MASYRHIPVKGRRSHPYHPNAPAHSSLLLTVFALLFAQRLSFGLEDKKLLYTCSADDIQWAGMTCPEDEPCQIFLELSSVSSAGGRVFLAGNIHSGQGTLYSVLLRSDDAGATWQEPLGRARGESLDHIQFENSQIGWVSGERAVPLAGDPFFLTTGDGGETWRKAQIFPEGSPGFVEKFHFDSTTSGKLVLEGANKGEGPNGLIYETKDGAKSWTLTPSGTAPTPEDDSLWRVRADKGGKSFSVEHSVAGKWVVASRFTILIAQCTE